MYKIGKITLPTFSGAQSHATDHRIHNSNDIAAQFKINAATTMRIDASPITAAFRFVIEFEIWFIVTRFAEFFPVGFLPEFFPL